MLTWNLWSKAVLWMAIHMTNINLIPKLIFELLLLSFWVTFGIPNHAWTRPFITSMDVYPQTKNQFHTTPHSWDIWIKDKYFSGMAFAMEVKTFHFDFQKTKLLKKYKILHFGATFARVWEKINISQKWLFFENIVQKNRKTNDQLLWKTGTNGQANRQTTAISNEA